jgi:glycosyltransferase involved in cell wall biosynthesis
MKILVIIPAFNAAYTLPELLERTLQYVTPSELLVVNDGSSDTTRVIAKHRGVHIIDHLKNRGKGAALQTGFDFALTQDCDAIITMDGDLQHQPEDIPRFIQLATLQNYDIIIGSRLHNKKGMPFHRILSNTITTFLVKTRTGINISDSQSGFRFIKKKVLESVRMQSNGFEAETEFLIKAAACGFTFGSLPIDTIYAGEKSHMTHVQTTMNFIKVLFKQY